VRATLRLVVPVLAALPACAPARAGEVASRTALEAGARRSATQEPAASQPIELGRVRWGREREAALAQARRSGKPLVLLFQEVPG